MKGTVKNSWDKSRENKSVIRAPASLFSYLSNLFFVGLSAGDCFELGRQSYNNGDYYHTVLWMQEAMDRLQEEQNRTTTSKSDILEYLAFSTYMQGQDR